MVLLDAAGCTVAVDELVLLDELELLTGCVVVVDDGDRICNFDIRDKIFRVSSFPG